MINENNNIITEKDLGEIDWDLTLSEDDLTAEEVFTGLLEFGLFSEKIPPCFTSIGLAKAFKKSLTKTFDEDKIKDIGERSHDYIRHEAIKLETKFA